MPTNIEWTDETINPIVGCTKISDGCKNCYAIRMAWRLQHMPGQHKYQGLTIRKNSQVNWTGKINYDIKNTFQPIIARKKPTRYFVNSMGDLFHPNVDRDELVSLFALMMALPRHTFQVLTKHPKAAADFLTDPTITKEIFSRFMSQHLSPPSESRGHLFGFSELSNIWIGTSVENESVARTRIDQLLRIPAQVHFISAEPLLGPIPGHLLKGLQWVIVGGESGPNARAMDPDWVSEIIDSCSKYKIPFFFKQWGKWSSAEKIIDGQTQTVRLLSRDTPQGLFFGKEYHEFPSITL